MPDEYASKQDVSRLEGKVDILGSNLHTLTLSVQTVRDQLTARELLEKQGQVMKAEIEVARATAAAEKSKNADEWNTLKTRSLWLAMALLAVGTYPGLVSVIKQVRAVLP